MTTTNECAYRCENECTYCHGKGTIRTHLTVGASDFSDGSTHTNSVGVGQECPHCHGKGVCPYYRESIDDANDRAEFQRKVNRI